jgi:omega-amidase
MKIAAVQMRIVDGSPMDNRDALSSLLDKNPNNDLYLVPELWTTGYVHEEWDKFAKVDTPYSIDWMANEARRRCIWLGGSIIAINSSDSLVNRFILFNRLGELVCKYDKVHLFRPLKEDVFLSSGKSAPPIIRCEGFRVSPAICYDIRFPEMFRRVAIEGVDIFLIPCEWPFPRQHALRIMTESRAIENQAVVVLANRIGLDLNGNEFCGCSAIYGPLERIVIAKDHSCVVSAKINSAEILNYKTSFPVLSHRVPQIDCV